MLKTAGRYTKILNYILVVLVFALLILQLLPYWDTVAVVQKENVDTQISIQGYVWWPLKPDMGGPNLTSTFEKTYGEDWVVADIVLMPIIVVVGVIMTFFFGIKKPTRLWMNIVYQFVGIAGVVAYLTEPIYQMNPIWILHLVVSVLIVGVSVANIVMRPWAGIVHYFKTGE